MQRITHRHSPTRTRGWNASGIATPVALAIVGALVLGGCARDTTVEVAPSSADESATPGLPPSPSAIPVPEPSASTPPIPPGESPVDREEKLKVARDLKEREKREPESYTVCVKPDGTFAGMIKHDRRPDAPKKTKQDKENSCRKQFDSPWEAAVQ